MAPFTPWHERARHEALVARLLASTLEAPVWLLCPREGLARSLCDRAARRGGAFVRTLDWDRLALSLDDALSLPFAPPATEAWRTVVVEQALTELASELPSLAAPLRTDPFGVARALLSVVDLLRHHRWQGALPAAPEDTSSAGALVFSHVSLLGALVRRLEEALAALPALDTAARLRRAHQSLASGEAPRSLPRLLVEGVDRLTPLQRDVLEGLRARGVEVDLAPWVEGWTEAPSPLPEPDPASTWLSAWERGEAKVPRGDDSITEVIARDPHDEAEHVARWLSEALSKGERPEDFAVAVPPDGASLARVSRALARYGLASHGACAAPVSRSPLWQVVRASVRLAWRGVDVVALSTVLAAPGAGLWGSDRDHLGAMLRRSLPTSWEGVRDTLARATEPVPAPSNDATEPEEGAAVIDLDAPDPARLAQLAEARKKVESLVSLWDTHGPFSKLPLELRMISLRAVVEETLSRLVNPRRFREGLDEPRTQAAWVASAAAIEEACKAALDALERAKVPLPAHDPGAFLGAAESLLGAVPDALSPGRSDGVALLTDDPWPPVRPRVLLALGAWRGRFPSTPGRALVLGPLERALLASWGGGLEALPDDVTAASLASREAARVLTAATEKLVVCSPRRRADGEPAEPSLVLRDLEAMLPEEAREARRRLPRRTVTAWCSVGSGEVPRVARALLAESVRALGAGEVSRAVALLTPLSGDVAVRDLARARFLPERRFDLGDLVREQLSTVVLSPSALESLLKCRYSFLTGALLGLRPLPLARAPSLSSRDRARVARAALRSLDAVASEGRRPDAGDVSEALEQALRAQLPWAERGDTPLALEELRRTVRAFLQRYLELRSAWALDLPKDAPEEAESAPVPLALPTGRTLRMTPQNPRVETLVSSDGARALVMDLRGGSVDGLDALRAAGLDVHAAVVPALVTARAGGEVAAFVRLSLSQPRGEAITDRDPDLPPAPSTTVVALDRDHRLGPLRDALLRRVGDEFEALAQPGAEYPPHSPERAQELARVGARSCGYCAMRLGCRFQLAGGA